MNEEKGTEEIEFVDFPVIWQVPIDTPVPAATNFVVQHTDQEFILSFFHVTPPILLGSPEDRKRQAEQIDAIRPLCVARVMVSPERMKRFIEAMKENYENFIQKLESEVETEQDEEE